MTLRLCIVLLLCALPAQAQDAVIRAGTVIHTDTGSSSADQRITVTAGRISGIEKWSGRMTDDVIDLRDRYVMPGMMDAHSHVALVVDERVDGGNYYVTGLLNPTPFRAVQGVANARDLLESGFTTIRDIGNNGNYADVAIKKGIDSGIIPGPHMETSGRIIAPFGGQFFLQPEKPGLGNPEYYFADGVDDIVKAVRQNLHFGSTFIKLVVDDQRYIYSVDEIRAAVTEAERAGTYVAAHCWTEQGARNAIAAGVRSIEHGVHMPDDVLQAAKDAGVFLVGTEFTLEGLAHSLPGDDLSAFQAEHDMFVDRLRRAYALGVDIVYGSDAVFWDPKMGRGHVTLDVLNSWREAGVSNADQLKAMTTTAARLLRLEKDRGGLGSGLAADLVAMPSNPLDDTNALYKIDFVMQNGKVVRHPGSH
ncbi:MAG: imidazolonepropionase-like amidohydrolase [Rhodothermales bacterium]|jgi:imidazolonepropionase-like amidohydrolase